LAEKKAALLDVYRTIRGERRALWDDAKEEYTAAVEQRLAEYGLSTSPIPDYRLRFRSYGGEVRDRRLSDTFTQDARGRWHSAKTGRFVREGYVRGFLKREAVMNRVRLVQRLMGGISYSEAKQIERDHFEAIDALKEVYPG